MMSDDEAREYDAWRAKTTAQVKAERADNLTFGVLIVLALFAGVQMVLAIIADDWEQATFWVVLIMLARIGPWQRRRS
jgi:hypothetical protein